MPAMTATTTPAFDLATAEGLSYFRATRHVGGSIAFVGHCWEDGGFSVNDAGEPTRDVTGNTVATFTVEALDPTNTAHRDQCEEWYAGN